jgi:hypothetical protein
VELERPAEVVGPQQEAASVERNALDHEFGLGDDRIAAVTGFAVARASQTLGMLL